MGSQAYSKPFVFSLSEEEREQLKYQKIMEIQSRQVMQLDLDPSTTNLLTEQTFVQWQNTWLDQVYDAFYYGDSYLFYAASAADNIYSMFSNPTYLPFTFPALSLANQQSLLLTNSLFSVTTSNQLDKVISKLDKLAGDDGNGNANINVNFQPLKDEIRSFKDDMLNRLDVQANKIDDINFKTQDISQDVEDIRLYNESIKINSDDLLSRANTLVDVNQHIDNDLHDIKTDLGDLLIQFGDGGSINGDTIKNLSESIANELNLTLSPVLEAETKKVVDSIDQKFELASSDMTQVGVAETAGNYLNSEMRSATDQLKSELQGLQYTNINAVVYDYDDYSNYYTLNEYAENPPSNDVFIRQKVQEYIDAVNYATENVKGQIVTRLDELKQSTLLTTSYDPEWLVVKAGALYSKDGKQFPDEDLSVDFSKIKLDSNISKAIYDWIYYILACVIIYRQFRKVVD